MYIYIYIYIYIAAVSSMLSPTKSVPTKLLPSRSTTHVIVESGDMSVNDIKNIRKLSDQVVTDEEVLPLSLSLTHSLTLTYSLSLTLLLSHSLSHSLSHTHIHTYTHTHSHSLTLFSLSLSLSLSLFFLSLFSLYQVPVVEYNTEKKGGVEKERPLSFTANTPIDEKSIKFDNSLKGKFLFLSFSHYIYIYIRVYVYICVYHYLSLSL